MLRYILCTTLAALLLATAAQATDILNAAIPVETRAIWIDAGAIPKTVEDVRRMVRDYHRTGFNLLLPETIMRGYAMYPSAILARDPRFAGAPDLLGAMVAEAHKLGMEVHPWVWVFRAGYTKDEGAILRAHPKWAELSLSGKDLSANGGFWISPAVPEARDFIASILAELVRNYDVDGLHLDYVRYEHKKPEPYGYGPASRCLFRQQYGLDPVEIEPGSFHEYEWEKFRERQVNTFVQRIALQTRSIKPRARISAAVAPIPDEARVSYMQNWPNWVDNKWVDFIIPMTYSSDDAHFGRMIARDRNTVCDRTVVVSGIGLFALNDGSDQMLRQVGIARREGAAGQTLFSSSHLKEPDAKALSEGPYTRPAVLPFRDPWTRSRQLCDAAIRARQAADIELADILTAQSNSLASYAAYQQAAVPYIPPTAPPLPQLTD